MMKIRTGDIYREQIPRYDLAKKFVSENVLDITYGKYTDYYKSKLLLDNGAKEIWSLDLVDKNQFISVRKIDKKGHILYEIKEKEHLNSKKFDLVIAFNVLSITNDVDYYSKKISENLSDSGVAIISVFSTNLSDNISEKIDDVNFFRKDELENHLKKYFNQIDFFSQENINDIKIKNIHPKKNMTNKKIKSVLRKK